MKFGCLGEKNGQNWIFRKNLIFGKKPKDNPKIKFFGFCQKSSPLMFLCTRFILLFCENGISRRKIWFSNYNPKPVRLKDFWNRNISNAIWDIMLIFWIQLVIHNEYKRISYLNGILVRFACECSECSQSIKLQVLETHISKTHWGVNWIFCILVDIHKSNKLGQWVWSCSRLVRSQDF